MSSVAYGEQAPSSLCSVTSVGYDSQRVRQPVPFGKYLLLDRISVGGMAEVFKAKSYGVEGFEKIIAIKRILPTMGEDRDFIKMFIDEAKIAGQLAHANICQIFELGRIDGSHFIAMEYIWGKDLLQIQNRLRKVKQQMPVPMACFCIAKVLEGLDYAHRKRDPLGRPLEIVHRDCSPQNVLVSYEGEVKVIDFGIAKATSRNSRTMAGVLKGKFGYMSPEQVRGLPLDRRSDIFALGTMLYECLTGERLFQGETDFSTLEKVRNVDVQNPRAINPAIPEAIEKVIMKALAKDVDDRYQWCSEMLADLQAYLMAQDAVFTAKSLSSWLKEVFSGEIEKERQQLEQYKRVGRDGLIAGVPAAEAKLDVVEHLGQAPEIPESDATQLGGPSFDDIEREIASNAAPTVGPASGSPATRPPADDGDFGEEAPTEIFGEIDNPPAVAAKPAPLPAAGRPATVSQPPTSRPPKPPPRGQTQSQPAMAAMGAGPLSAQRPASMPPPMAAQPMAMQGDPSMGAQPMGPMGQMDPMGPMDPMGMQPPGYVPVGSSPPQGFPQQQQPYQQPYPPQNQWQGTPNQPMQAQQPPAAQKTMLGMQSQPMPPQGNYGQQYRVSGPIPTQQPYGQQPYPQHSGPYPVSPQYPSSPQMPNYGYGQAVEPSGPIPVTSPTPAPNKKKSSIGRDVAIGIAIAAVVLGGFLAVKFLVLDADSGSGTATGSAETSTIATLRMQLPEGTSAELWVDDKRIATVSDKKEVPVSKGMRRVKLVGPNGTKCEATLDLPGGKITPLECALKPGGPTSTDATGSGSAAVATPDVGSGSGSAAATPDAGSGSGGSGAAGSGGGAGGGSAIAAATNDKMPPEDTKPAEKIATNETKPVEDKKPVEVNPFDKTPIKTTVDKTVDKTVEKKPTTVVDKKPAEIKAVDKKPVEDKKPPEKVTTTDKKPVEDKKPAEKTTPAAVDTSGKGYLHVFSKPSAKVLVDGVETGLSTPITGRSISLTPGRHKVTFQIGGDKFTYAVNIKAGATEVLSKDLPVQ